MKASLGWLAAALVLSAGAAEASSAISLITPGTESVDAGHTLGFEFSTLNAQSITALGIYDSGKDGLADTAQIGVWDTFGHLVASATIKAGGGTLDGFFRYVAITPVALDVGTHYVVGAYDEHDAQSSWAAGQGGTAALNLNLNYFGNRFSSTGALSYADSSSGGGAFLGGNFKIEPTSRVSAAPEPATWALMLAGFGLAGVALRRRTAALA
ncbi:PEPxxWA-CTERM sorting domain-containing protein [Phenylobacterium sp.]|uniref:PEPxxWA-CTERM sorting domain-containing protein n=1 Tax=Phenylobacterium sp. TaxID=1871053 RepID=UPI0025F6365E|nr:PEPxxWA-CTERM sorting domain-containing protein [Phenylobacterium sp.]